MAITDWKHKPSTWKVSRVSCVEGGCPACEGLFVGLAVAITTPSHTSVICESCWVLLLMDCPELEGVPIGEAE